MAGLNNAQIIGRLGADPEIKYTAAGDAVTTIGVATSESWKDKTTGEKKEKTEWHRCTLWRRLAEIAGEYLHKGDQVYLSGPLETRKWQDQNGQDRYTTQINVRDMQMLGNKGGTSQATAQPARQHQPEQPPQQTAAEPDFSADVPF